MKSLRIVSFASQNPLRQAELRDALSEHGEDVEISFAATEDEACELIKGANVLLAHRFTEKFFYSAPYLKWVHLSSAGVERSLFKEFVDSDVILTNSRGMHARPMAEWVMAGLYYWSQQFQFAEEWRLTREWKEPKKHMTESRKVLHGMSALVVGYGEVGRGIADVLKANGLAVEAVATRGRSDIVDVYPMEQLEERLMEADIVVIALPATPKTIGLFNRRIFPLMKQGSIFVNVARGSIVDETDLIAGLKTDKPGYAILDVFDEEPLPDNSELFDLPNVFMTPHVSGNFPEYTQRVHDIFIENVVRYSNDRPLLFEVDKKRGY